LKLRLSILYVYVSSRVHIHNGQAGRVYSRCHQVYKAGPVRNCTRTAVCIVTICLCIRPAVCIAPVHHISQPTLIIAHRHNVNTIKLNKQTDKGITSKTVTPTLYLLTFRLNRNILVAQKTIIFTSKQLPNKFCNNNNHRI